MTSNEITLTKGTISANAFTNGCTTTIQPSNTWHPSTWETTTYPQYVYVQGDVVTISVIETIDGFKGQILLKMGNQNIIVWESDAFHKDDFDTIESDGKTVPPAPVAQARQAAQDAAESRAEAVLKKLFQGES